MTRPAGAEGGETLAVVVKGWPRLSETFIAQELHGLEQRGLNLTIVSLRHPTEGKTHPIHRAMRAPVHYLPEYLHRAPLRIWRGWRLARRLPGYRTALHAWLRDWRRDPTPNRGRRFGQALVLAAEIGDVGTVDRPVRRFYAHFLHTPGSVVRYAAMMLGLPWSCSAHAKDIWTIPEWEKREKLADMTWLATCTGVGRDHLAGLTDETDKVRLVYHGLDLTALPPPERSGSGGTRTGRDPGQPIRIVSVGRAVPKKGFDTLLQALAALPASLHWRLTHIGGGFGRRKLEKLARSLGIADRIRFLGSQSRDTVFAALAGSDLFVLASRVAPDGDRDGLPNVLMEAASQKLCLVSTSVSAIPEFIDDGRNGVLIPPDKPIELSRAIARLAADPDRRNRLGVAAYETLVSRFSTVAGLDRLAAWLQPDTPSPTLPEAAVCA